MFYLKSNWKSARGYLYVELSQLEKEIFTDLLNDSLSITMKEWEALKELVD